jgi:hypothetical protein
MLVVRYGDVPELRQMQEQPLHHPCCSRERTMDLLIATMTNALCDEWILKRRQAHVSMYLRYPTTRYAAYALLCWTLSYLRRVSSETLQAPPPKDFTCRIFMFQT